MRRLTVLVPLIVVLTACAATQPPPPPPVAEAATPPIVRTVEINKEIGLGLNMRLEDWTIAHDTPDFLIEEFAHHIEHELEAQGLTRSQSELLNVAQKRLAANEAYIYNPDSLSYIMVDFSKLRDSEKPPTRQSVFDSARYAGQSLETEEGISDLTSAVSSVHVQGAEYAFRLDADFLSHDEPRKFSGIVGFADPYWFFIYYTDTLAGSGDYAVIDNLLENLTILRKGP